MNNAINVFQRVANGVEMLLKLVSNINYTKEKSIIRNVFAVGRVHHKLMKANNFTNSVVTHNGKLSCSQVFALSRSIFSSLQSEMS